MENKAAGQYLARVKRALVCGKTDRCRLLERCAAMIDVFQQENPGTGYDGLVAAFGEPDTFVSELLSGLDEATVKIARKRRQLIRWGAVAVIIVVLIVMSAFLYIKYRQSTDIGQYFYVIEGVPQQMPPDEVEAIIDQLPKESLFCEEE